MLTLEDIELKNVQIDLNDDAMATHVYVAGSSNPARRIVRRSGLAEARAWRRWRTTGSSSA